MAIERGRGARRFRTYLRKRRCYKKIAEEIAARSADICYRRSVNVARIRRDYMTNEGRKHVRGYHSHCCGDCDPGTGCPWHFFGIRQKHRSQVESLDAELEEYDIFAPKSKPNRTWDEWKGRRR